MIRYYVKLSLIGIVISLLFANINPIFAEGTRQITWAPGEVIVKFKDDVAIHVETDGEFIKTGISLIDAINLKYKVRAIDKIFKSAEKHSVVQYIETPQGKIVQIPQLFNVYRLTFPEASDIQELVRIFTWNPYVEYAEPNYLAQMCLTPNDPLFGQQWGFTKIQASDAWDIETGDTSVVIGILDTGIDTNHIDLASHLWVNTDEIPGNGIDDDGNGYIDDIYGWNFVDDTSDVDDGAGHGSHCAGIVSAVTDNSIGVAGTSWDSKLMAVKVLNNNGVGLYSDIAQGIYYAADNGAKVINMSLGGYAFSQMWEDALVYAYATSVPVGAAGNDAVVDSFYPACFDVVLGVAGTDSVDIKWDGSNYGEWVDLSAPAVFILSTKLDDNYGYFTGTSEAAPFVSGVAALVASYKPTFSTGAIMNMITNNTDPIDSLNPGYAGMLGSGRLNAYKVLIGDSFPDLVVYSDTIDDSSGDNDGIPDAGETVNLILVLQNNGTDATGVSTILHTDDIDITISDSTASFGDILAREKGANSSDVFTFSVSDTCPQHDVLFQLYITANSGAFEDTVEFSIATQAEYNVSGIIDTNTTWHKGTYIVVGNTLVQSGVTLTIEPGAEIRIDPGLYIRVDGNLNAIGTEEDSIIFTRNDTTARWDRLWFTSGSRDTIKYCRIEWAGNTGILSEGDSLYVGYSTISNNFQPSGADYGAGIHSSGSATITHNAITNNSSGSDGGGGGIYVDGLATISNNTISYNFAPYGGGGIWAVGNVTIANNSIFCNSDSMGGQGAGIRCEGTISITGNEITDNFERDGGGGGIYSRSGTVTITYNIISNNSTEMYGAGIYIYSGSALIKYNTISYNFAPYGGGIYTAGSMDTIANNIIFNNFANHGNSIYCNGNALITYNTMIDTAGSTIYNQGNPVGIHGNNICATGYAIYNNSSNNIPADSNWWGTIETDTIDAHIWDFYDDFNLGIVNYQPILTSPSQTTPPYLDSLTLYPDPVGVETLYVYLTFSKPMNTAIEAEVLFAIDDTLIDTLSAYQFTGAWTDTQHWDGWYYIDEMVLDSLYRIRVAKAEDDSGFVIPPDESHTFLVYTAGSVARELFAEPSWDRVNCRWHEAGISNLLGYNLYCSMVSGGPYTQINQTVIADTIYTDFDVSGGNTYYYVYTILDNNWNESSYSSEAEAYVGIEEGSMKPAIFALYDIFPNPFVRETSIGYALPQKTHVYLHIYDVQGRLVKTLIDGTQTPGYYKVVWGGTDHNNRTVANGVYFYRFETEDFKDIKKLVLLR
ncbi:MAG: S8 family serine peptidase [bacterium]